MRGLLAAMAVAAQLSGGPALAQDLIPERRAILSADTDLPGGDIASTFDTTPEACQRACLSDAQCTAFTFNARNGSCFVKADPGPAAFFEGALSGRIAPSDPAARAAAGDRRADLAFIPDWEIAAANAQAEGLAARYPAGDRTAEDLRRLAAEAEAMGDAPAAAQFSGAAAVVTDAPGDWADHARRLILAGERDPDNQRLYREGALAAAINGYLRATDAGMRHTVLVTLADALERLDRGSDGVKALRLAQAIGPRDDTAALLASFAARYGFRILGNDVQSDSARPRICATFSEDLAQGTDYSAFVQLPGPGLTVTPVGPNQLCVEGVEHGARYALTFRAGLPAADGQVLAGPVALTQYVRDRSPGVRFPGRAYVLPATGSAALPVETVNTATLDLALYAVSDRNLLRAIQADLFARPIPQWQEPDFEGRVGAQLWSGTATVAQTVNRDVTTRLPLDEAVAGRGPGVYVLRAAVPGADPYATPAAWQWFVVSDLGLTTLSGVDGLHVIVRSLGDAGAKPGITVELLSEANAVLGTATTDAMGYARFDAGLARGTGGDAPAMVVARDGDRDLAFLSLTEPEFDLSDRGVEGREAAPPVDVFLATDRGAYRAGETIRATALARDAAAQAVEGLPLTAILRRPDGVEYSRAAAQDQGAGGRVFALPVAGNAPRGVWRLEVLADLEAEPLAARTVLVEDFLPERIDVDVTVGEAPLRLGGAADLTVGARYLFGAPGADLAVEGETLVRPAGAVAGFEGYAFGRHDAPFDPVMQPFAGAARTDAAGLARVAATLPEAPDPGRPLEARFTVRVAEGSGRPVERQVVQPLAPTGPMIGIRPLFGDVVAEGTEARFALVGLDASGAPAAMPVRWTLTRVETDYQWYSADGTWNWEPVVTRSRAAEGTLDLAAGSPATIAAPVGWGEYELLVERADGGAASSVAFYAGWYAPADASATPDTLELSLDRPAYRPGDTATLRIVPRAAGTALVMVLSNRLVAMRAVEVAEGENIVTLPVTDDWGAGVYVTASVLRPMEVAAGRNPARALGLTHAGIDPGPRRLRVAVETAPEAAPRGPLEIAVRVEGVAAGETAFATIAAVDEGILNLTAYEAPDPAAYYFGQRRLGVGIRDLYGRLIDGMAGAQGQVRSGGDAGAQARLMAPPPTEALVAFFSGPVTVGPDGVARATFDLPSFNGNVRAMAVVWSRTGVGQAQADVLVRDPVVVTASLPRFMAPGDTSRLLLEVVHATGPSGRMGLDALGRGVALGPVPSGVDLADGGKAVLRVPVTAGAVGIRSVETRLTTPDGRVLTKTLALPVQVNDPPVARISRFDLAPGQTFTFGPDAFAGLIPGSGTATLAVGPLARLNAPGLLAALDRYPYGCTEQIVSRALPLLYLNAVAEAVAAEGDADIGGRIGEAITEVLANQTAEGAFGLWSPQSGDFWLDAYVTDFLSRARAQGHAVPDTAFRSALDNLRNQVNTQPDFDRGGEALAYALMVLAREGAAAIGDLRYYADVKGDAFATPMAQAQLGAALASYGDQVRADAMFRRAGAALDALAGPETEQVFRADYGTNRRDAAAVLTLAVEAGSRAVDREALADRLATQGPNLSTQEAVWSLLAANALAGGGATEGIAIDGVAASGPLARVLDAEAATPVTVRNDGAAPTTVTVTTYGVPAEPEPAGGNGYAIARRYYTLEGEPATPDGVVAGTRLVAVLEVTPFARGEARLMVSDPLPAGFEIDNPNLIAGGQIAGLEALDLLGEVANAEFRQDRFLAAVDRFDNRPFRLGYVVRAVSPGTFRHPAASVEDMYRPDFRARTDAGTVTIRE